MKKKTHRLCAFALCLAMTLCLPGCAAADELEDLGVVAGAALDCDESGGVMLTVEVVGVSSNEGEGAAEAAVFTATGESLAAANEKLVTLAGHQLYWAHAALFIISRSVARQGIGELLQYIMRNGEIRIAIPIYLADTPTARELFDTKQPAYAIQSFGLRDKMNAAMRDSLCVDAPAYRLYDSLCSPSRCGVIPIVAPSDGDGEALLQPNGSGILRDFRLAGELDEAETACYIMSRDQFKSGLLTDGDFSYEVRRCKTELRARRDGDRIEFTYDVRLELNLAHSNRQADKREQIQIVQNDLRAAFQKLFRAYYSRTDADFLELANAYRRQDAAGFQQLEDPDRDVKERAVIDVRPEIEIRSFGQAEGIE